MKKNTILITICATVLGSIYTNAQVKDTISELQEVEIFGDRNKKQRGLESVTRFPGSPQDQLFLKLHIFFYRKKPHLLMSLTRCYLQFLVIKNLLFFFL